MQANNETNGKEDFEISVPDIYHLLLLGQLARARGLDVRVKQRSKKGLGYAARKKK